MLDTIKLWLRKAVFVTGVFTLTAVSTSASAADTCTSVVGNLMIANNCGFDSGVTSPWTVVGTNGSLSIASVAASPSGNPYMVVTPNTNSIYSIKSGTFNIQAGIVYHLGFYIKADSVASTIDSITLTGPTNVFLFFSYPVTPGTWNFVGASLTAVPAGAYQFAIADSSSAMAIDVDGFFVVPVPEPASMLLLGSLCSAVVAYRKRLVR